MQAALTKCHVSRPVGRVEGTPGGSDRALQVTDGGVGGNAQHLFGGRRDRLVGPASFSLDQLAVDQQSLFVPHRPRRPFIKTHMCNVVSSVTVTENPSLRYR